MDPPRIRKTFSGFAPDLQIDLKETVHDLYFHREGLDVQENQESDDCVSTDTEAANTVRHLQLHCPAATASLQMAVHEALAPATATWPQEEEYQYDSDDSVLDLDEEYPGLTEQVMQCKLPVRAPPALHRGGHPILVGPSSPTSTNYPIWESCWTKRKKPRHANGCLNNQWPRHRYPSPVLGTWTANASNVTIKR